MEKQEGKSPGLSQATWLMERMSARKRPITGEQVEKFGKHPAGPILPDLCLEAVRLPDEYGKSMRYNHENKAIWALTAAHKGGQCVITVIDGKVVMLSGREKIELISENTDDTYFENGEIVGLTRRLFSEPSPSYGRYDPRPVSIMQVTLSTVANSVDVYPQQTDFLFAAQMGLPYPSYRIDSGIINGVSVLRDGLIMYQKMNCNVNHNPYQIVQYDLREGSKIIQQNVKRYYTRFFQVADRMLGIWIEDKKDEKSGRKKTVYLAGYIDEEKPVISLDDIVDCVNTAYGMRLVWYRKGVKSGDVGSDGYKLITFGADKGKEDKSPYAYQDIGENRYISNFTELSNDHFAYIGVSTRDNLQCWVVDGKEQIGFDLVSPLFQRDDKWLYYGVIGRHLYTMALPDLD